MTLPTWQYNSVLRNSAFGAIADSPGTWVLSALELKAAADRLDYFRFPVKDEEACLSLVAVHRYMIGLSLENLLKGMLAVQGEAVLTNGTLSAKFATHKLSQLASVIDASKFTFSAADLEVLTNLEPFVIWAGRYPLPKSANDLIVKGGSSREYDAERDLWGRLYEVLLAVAWIQKPGGVKMFLNGKTVP